MGVVVHDVAHGVAGVRGARQGGLHARQICSYLFSCEEMLQVGLVAPNIVGEDIDGVKFQLEDYRGKVVVLDFWGFW